MRLHDQFNRLFSRASLSDALRAHAESIPERVQRIAESVMRVRQADEVIEEIVNEMLIAPLELDTERRTMRREEITVDVTNDPMRMGFPDGRRLLVPGIRVTVSIPFRGDEQLWYLSPSQYRLSPPRGTVHADKGSGHGVLELVIEQPADQPIAQFKATLDQSLENLAFFIDNQRKDLANQDALFRSQVAAAVTARRSRLRKHEDLTTLLGIPEAHSRPELSTTEIQTESRRKSTDQSETWDVFISHASEDKESLVRPLVAALTANGLRVWFDEMTLRVGDSLRRSIDRGLAKSRFGVVVVSKAFLAKHWPQVELDGLVAREADGTKVILPVWHEITAAEVRVHSPILADRLAVHSSRGVQAVASALLQVIRTQ